MFDQLLDLFDRDKRTPAGAKRGGFLAGLQQTLEGDDRRSSRYDHDDLDDRRSSRYDHDDLDDRRSGREDDDDRLRGRRRDRDGFDFGDD